MRCSSATASSRPSARLAPATGSAASLSPTTAILKSRARSPGELIVHAVVRDAIARGFKTFDLGVGEARYKEDACEAEEELFDSAFAITPLGRVAALAFMAKQRAKRRIKHSPRLLALFVRRRGAARG